MFIALLGDSILPHTCPINGEIFGENYKNFYGTTNLQMDYDSIFELVWRIKDWDYTVSYDTTSGGIFDFIVLEETFDKNLPQDPTQILNCNGDFYFISFSSSIQWKYWDFSISEESPITVNERFNWFAQLDTILQWSGIGGDIASGLFTPFFNNTSGFAPASVTRNNFNFNVKGIRVDANFFPVSYHNYN